MLRTGDCVVVHAHAGGTVHADEAGRPLGAPEARRVEWITAYWVADGLIRRIEVLALEPLDDGS